MLCKAMLALSKFDAYFFICFESRDIALCFFICTDLT